MQKRLYFSIVSSFCLICLQMEAQLNGKYTFRHIDQEDGLLHTTVNGITQDERGFMWILTLNGLQRFDGHRFIHYPQISKQCSYNEINSSTLTFNPVGNTVDIYSYYKINRFDPTMDTLSSIMVPDRFKSDTVKPVLYTGQNHEKWLIGQSGFVIYNKDTSSILYSCFNPDHQKERYLLRDPITNDIWMARYDDVMLAHPGTKTIEFAKDEMPSHPLLRQIKNHFGQALPFRMLMLDSQKSLWLITWKDILLRYDFNTEQFFIYSLTQLKNKLNIGDNGHTPILVNFVFEDRQGQIWLATDNLGLLAFDRAKNDFNAITSDDKITNGLTYSYSILHIFQDRNDNIWLGTDRGISIFNPYKDQFQSIRHLDGNEASIPLHDIIDLIETAQGEILVATWGGGITLYDQEWNFKRTVHFKGDEFLNLVWSFVRNDDGTIWAGTQGGFIHIYDPVSHVFSTIHPVEMQNATIKSMCKDHDGNILMGLHNGKVAMWNKNEQKFYAYNDAADTLRALMPSVNDIMVDDANRCWTSHELNIKSFDISKMAFTGYYQIKEKETDLGKRCNGLAQYNDSILLVGVGYGGIQAFNIRTKIFSPFLADESLQHASVCAIHQDKMKNIWFTTDFFLYKFTPDKNLIRYNLDKSIIRNALGSSRFSELSDGRWATSTPSEIICFDPAKLSLSDHADLKVEISNFKVFDKEIGIDSFLLHHRPVVLPYDQNFIFIEFSTLHFVDVRQTNYYYRLTGVDKDWIYSDTRQFADYTDLKPGEYTFEVKAANGNIPSAITSVPIVIKPPWWGTFWFRATVLLAIGGIFYVLLKRRIQVIRHESELKNQIAQTEMMALRSQMNPHFIFNCLTSIDNLIQTNQKEKATTYLAKFAQLIRAILENSKNNVIPCWKDLEALKLYLDMEALRWDNKIKCTLDIDPQIQMADYKVPPMIIQPLVENAIHHGLLNKTGPDKKLDITVALDGEHIKYTILDNGVGRVKAAEYKKLNRSSLLSFGMDITMDRVRLFNENENQSIKITDLYNEHDEPAGTKVEVWLTTETIAV